MVSMVSSWGKLSGYKRVVGGPRCTLWFLDSAVSKEGRYEEKNVVRLFMCALAFAMPMNGMRVVRAVRHWGRWPMAYVIAEPCIGTKALLCTARHAPV
jgi:hypothetical protein